MTGPKRGFETFGTRTGASAAAEKAGRQQAAGAIQKKERRQNMYIKHYPTDECLSEAYFKYLNSVACRQANPFSSTFWLELRDWLTSESSRAEECQKADGYRAQLAPYRLRRVNLIAESWRVARVFDHTVQLCLSNVRLAHVYGQPVGCAPNVPIAHINLLVSNRWFGRIAPSQDEGLSVIGMLYEYVSSKNQRNIGIMGVAVMPRSRKVTEVRPMLALGEDYAA